MNSPLEIRKVRLRGLGGPAVYGVPRTRRVRNRDEPSRAVSAKADSVTS
jgi:hypothetical protein